MASYFKDENVYKLPNIGTYIHHESKVNRSKNKVTRAHNVYR